MQRVSVVLLTRNEEALIGRALASARAFADEIMLIDSNSTDRTKEIAEAAGATVYNQDWLGWVGQRRKAASLARNDWLFFLEADEIVTPELAADIRLHMAGDPEPGSGFTVERKDEFLGRLMFEMRRASKRAGFVRLYNRTRSDWRSDMLVHEELACPGPLVRLKGSMLHWRNYAIADQIATYNRYSELEMREMLSKSNRVPDCETRSQTLSAFSLGLCEMRTLATRRSWFHLELHERFRGVPPSCESLGALSCSPDDRSTEVALAARGFCCFGDVLSGTSMQHKTSHLSEDRPSAYTMTDRPR